MKLYFLLLGLFFTLPTFAQNKVDYLQKNRFDLTATDFDFSQKNCKIIGFGAYHGSAKTEDAEHALLASLTESGTVKYYLPETDFSVGHYFNQFLQNGDTELLADLVLNYGARVPQEQSIETYEKWLALKKLNDGLPPENKLTVVGTDVLVSSKYVCKHLLELIDYQSCKAEPLLELAALSKSENQEFSDEKADNLLEKLLAVYAKNSEKIDPHVKDKFAFWHLLKNLEYAFADAEKAVAREQIIYNNYLDLSPEYKFEEKPQFVRYGFAHLEKQREGGSPSFFTMLIENEIYAREEVIAVIGYLTESRVLWNLSYNKNGDYKKYNTKGGFGIGDYKKEYFRGIDKLKAAKISDITLFRLNQKDTPYNDGNPDLIEVVMKKQDSNGAAVKGRSTTEFLDYAVLISGSKANVPIQEMMRQK